MSSVETLLGIVLGSQAFAIFIQYKLTKRNQACTEQRLQNETLAAIAYATLSKDVDWYMGKGYATAPERKSLGILFDVYLKNGWNSDMESRVKQVYKLPMCPPDKERKK